ncbi:MAG: cysteine hydrolase [Alphaproteobacteria bacterium]|nr:cysteine hydrolase [Alphaproteobacteria bacterium]
MTEASAPPLPPGPVFPQAIVDSLIVRRGRVHITDAIDPARTALVVIDMQRAFTEAGIRSGTDAAKAVIPSINRLAGALRAAGGTIAFSLATFTDAEDGGWPGFYRRMVSPEVAATRVAQLRPSSPLHALDPALDVLPGDFLFPKCRYSAFARGASPLESHLRGLGIGTVIVVGTITNVCCESTARDAMQLGFDTIMVADANAARDQGAHRATLETFIQFFGDVLTTEQLLALIERARRANSRAAE